MQTIVTALLKCNLKINIFHCTVLRIFPMSTLNTTIIHYKFLGMMLSHSQNAVFFLNIQHEGISNLPQYTIFD